MATTITKNFVTSDNRLFKARLRKANHYKNDGNNNFSHSEIELEQIKVNGKWVNLEVKGRYIKTKTLCCTKVNHNSSVSKVFTESKRYQVSLHSGMGQNAGYIYDKDGNAWQLYRDEDVGFTSLCGTYKWEAKYS